MIFFSLEGRPVSGVVRKFKCLLKKTQSFYPCSSALNRSGKGLILLLKLDGSTNNKCNILPLVNKTEKGLCDGKLNRSFSF